ncbi:MAG: peptidoglycan-binding domain-containing protein [Myxococcota bacterium]
MKTAWIISSMAALGMTAGAVQAQNAVDLPPNAKAGQCYARVHVPASYETDQQKVVRREASTRIETVAPVYEWVEQKVLVKEATEKLEIVPAAYEWKQEEVTVKPASFKLVPVPAKYEMVEEKIEVRPARTEWKKGRGPVEKVNHSTGEIMCLVEVPAEYKTVKKRVLKSAATTQRVEIPAVKKNVRKRVVKTPSSTKKVTIPAEYRTVRVQKLVQPAQEKKIEIPAEYETVTKRRLVSDSKTEWREVLCETNIRPDTIQALQRALKNAGHDPGPIDGVVGRETLEAVNTYQKAKGLPTGGLTIAVLNSLGVKIR